MYKQCKNDYYSKPYVLLNVVERLTDNAFIPFDPANTDYQQFKIQVADGVELQDPDGNVMTQAEADAFLETLP